jgi:hypothetical protein
VATPTFFNSFKRRLGDGTIDLDDDAFVMYLSNNAPSVSAHTVLADIAAITTQNGYAPISLTGTTWVASGNNYSFRNNSDESWTASGGNFGPFQYVLIYDDTVASPLVDPLVLWWNVGSATTITTGNSFTVDLDSNFEVFLLSS